MAEKEGNVRVTKVVSKGGCGAGYTLGMIGAVVYYCQHAYGFGGFLVAVLKALVWPAFLVHDVLKFIG